MNPLNLEGLPVTKVYYAGQQPAISNGMYRLENNSGEKICLKEIQLKILVDDEKIAVQEFFIYRLPDYDDIPPQDFCIGPGEVTTVDISFPFVNEHANPSNEIKIALSFFAGGQRYTGFSAVNIEIRHS